MNKQIGPSSPFLRGWINRLKAEAENQSAEVTQIPTQPDLSTESESAISLYNEMAGQPTDPKQQSHYIMPHGYIYPLYNEITTQEEAGLRPAYNAASPLEAATRPATPVEENGAASASQQADWPVRSNLAEETDTEKTDRRETDGPVDNVPVAPVEKNSVVSEREGESFGDQLRNQTVPARRSPEMPPLKNCTRIHAQIFARESNPNTPRYKFRNVKLYFWTTTEIEHLASSEHMEAQVIFNMCSVATMSKAVKRNTGKSISAARAEGLLKDCAALKRENSTLGVDQEESTIAYLVLRGPRSNVKGSKLVADQICILQWKRLPDKAFVPLITLFDGETAIEITCDVNVREKNNHNRRAAQHVGYHDPLNYNEYRKQKRASQKK